MCVFNTEATPSILDYKVEGSYPGCQKPGFLYGQGVTPQGCLGHVLLNSCSLGTVVSSQLGTWVPDIGAGGSVALDYLYLNSCEKEIRDHVEATLILTFVVATDCFS